MRSPSAALISVSLGFTLTVGYAAAPVAPDARLQAPSPGARHSFGFQVDVSGDTLIVGAPGTTGGSPLRAGVGAAHVFVRNNSGAWTLHTSLSAGDDEGTAPGFGKVAIDGDILVVGANYGDGDGPDHVDTGVAHVYERDASGHWQHHAKLAPSVADPSLAFGNSVAISGSTIVVSAHGAKNQAGTTPTGAAYVYTRDTDSGVWSLEQVLRGPNQNTFTSYGEAVAIDGDTIVVGAWQDHSGATGVNGDESDTSAQASGAAFVYTRDGGTWTQQAYLKASNTGALDLFGQSVAVSGNRVLVGAPNEDTNPDDNTGAGYLFVRAADTGEWTQEAYLKAATYLTNSRFGSEVALAGYTAVLGAPTLDFDRNGLAGEIAWFALDTGGWTQRGTELESGHVVALSGSTLIVGSPSEYIGTLDLAGAAYVFTLPDTTPPVVTPPPDIETVATGELTAVDLGTATVTDDSGEALTATPDHPGLFPVGTTIVTWSATDSAGNTGTATQSVTITAAADPLDLDVNTFRATGRVSLNKDQPVTFTFKVKNESSNATDSGTATLVGTLDGVEVYRVTLTGITDAPGGSATSWDFPPYLPTALGTITWVLTVADTDPDEDVATATTRVVR